VYSRQKKCLIYVAESFWTDNSTTNRD